MHQIQDGCSLNQVKIAKANKYNFFQPNNGSSCKNRHGEENNNNNNNNTCPTFLAISILTLSFSLPVFILFCCSFETILMKDFDDDHFWELPTQNGPMA